MSWMNDSNGFSEDDLKSLFDLRPGIDCDIQTISWRKFADVSTNEPEPELDKFTSEETYKSWLTQCRETSERPVSSSLILVMHARLEGGNMKRTSLPYGEGTFRQTSQKLKQHRSIARVIGRTSTALFHNRTVKWEPEQPCDQSIVYHCRSDTESIRTPDDITVSSTFMVNDSTTLAVMYGCTPGVMKRTKDWLKELKEPTFHPLTLPMIFAELERKRLLHAFSREDTEVSQRVLNMDSRKQGIGWGMEEMTQRDCDSTRLWLRISRLKVGLGSLKTQLESMIRHSRNLSDTVFTQAGGEHKTQRASGDRIVDRLEEMIAEIEGKNQACDGLLGGMTLAMQIESNYYTRRDADSNTRIAQSNTEMARDAKRDSDHMQTMSFLGMMFLPGTFFATMFSMSFFKFDPSEGTPLISPWISLYFGLTILCTILIFFSWKVYVRKTEKRQAAKTLDVEKGHDSQFTDSDPGSP